MRSNRAESKKARRNKRRAKRNANWIPDSVLDGIVDDVELVEDLESFDARITERGWAFDDEQSDDDFVIWFYPPSGTEVAEGFEPVTTIWLHAAEGAETVHVVLVGTAGDRPMTQDGFFERIDAIEAYRSGDSTTP
ncbi:hypothetical protein DVS77_30525 [Mycolicibacterium moriokaense]|nr:hypothetical protein DVS77_30525 [Mycolicibacterium moriokaense]